MASQFKGYTFNQEPPYFQQGDQVVSPALQWGRVRLLARCHDSLRRVQAENAVIIHLC